MAKESRRINAIKSLSTIDIDIKKHYKTKRKLNRLLGALSTMPKTYTVWNHNIRNEDLDIHVRVFTPPNADSENTVLFFHGGGWATGDIDSYKPVCIELARVTGCTVVAVDYRLAPEHKFPKGVEDCYFVAKSICQGYFEGIIPSKIILTGDSAGGNIAAAVSLMARDRGEFKPEAQILIYPSTYNDHTPSSPFKSIVENGTDYLLTSKMIEDYISLYKNSDEDLDNPYFAPLLARDFSNQPDTLIITAGLCPLRDEGEFYGTKLIDDGNYAEVHRIDDAIHGFISVPFKTIYNEKAYSLISSFLEKRVKNIG